MKESAAALFQQLIAARLVLEVRYHHKRTHGSLLRRPKCKYLQGFVFSRFF